MISLEALTPDWDRVKHAIKIAIGCVIGILCAKAISLPTQWVLITVLVVMLSQPRVGAVLQKSYMRFIGTAMGAAISVVSLAIFGNDYYPTMMVLCLAAMLFGYLATSASKFSEASTLGVVTVAIILLTPNTSLTIAGLRFIEISLGIVIAFLVSSFVLPIRSKAQLLSSITNVLREIQTFYTALFVNDQAAKTVLEDSIFEEEIIKAINVQKKLFPEVLHESFKNRLAADVFRKIIRCEREIMRCLSFMDVALAAISFDKIDLFTKSQILKGFNTKVEQRLHALVQQLVTKKFTALASLSADNSAWQEQMRSIMLASRDTLSSDDILHMSTFIFCAEHLCIRLDNFAEALQQL